MGNSCWEKYFWLCWLLKENSLQKSDQEPPQKNNGKDTGEKKDPILWLISLGKRRMETHVLSVNICRQECAPFPQLNKFHGSGESFDALSKSCPARLSIQVLCMGEALQSYKIHKNGRNLGFFLSLRLLKVASAKSLAWGALGLADC